MTTRLFRIGCQTYSWQMSLNRYQGRLAHIAGIVAESGFAGLEPETIVLGPGWSAQSLRQTLDGAGLELAALCLVGRWRGIHESPEEQLESAAVLDAVTQFPGAIVNLVMYPGDDRADLKERQDNALSCMREIATKAADRGVLCSFHPNSPRGSVFRVRSDYDYLLDHLDPRIGFTPDFGHIVAGGMNPIEMIRQTMDRIRHVHIKDIDARGAWAPTGYGVLDIPGIVGELVSNGYDRWIVFEDESPLAEADPDQSAQQTGRYVREVVEAVGMSELGEEL